MQFFLSFTKVNKKSETSNKRKDFLDLLSLEILINISKANLMFKVLYFRTLDL